MRSVARDTVRKGCHRPFRASAAAPEHGCLRPMRRLQNSGLCERDLRFIARCDDGAEIVTDHRNSPAQGGFGDMLELRSGRPAAQSSHVRSGLLPLILH